MAYVTPSTVVAGQTYSAASHNIIVNDIIDHEDRLDTVQNAQYPARNVLVNGAMQFAQRATSATGISSNTDASNYYTADRWVQALNTAGTTTQAVTADTPSGYGFRNALRVTCATALTSLSSSSYLQIGQRLEGQTLQHIRKGTANAQQLTLSFWVKSNKTGTYIAELRDEDNTRAISQSYTVSATDTWEQKTVTFAADTTGVLDNDNASSLSLRFWLAAGTDYSSGSLSTTWASVTNANRAVGQTNLVAAVNNYWQITGVQLEPGSQASPFEFVRYDDELRRCQRYFISRGGSATFESVAGPGIALTTTSVQMYAYLPVQMRISPSVSYVGNVRVSDLYAAATNMTSVSNLTDQPGTSISVFTCTVASGLTQGRTYFMEANNDTSARLRFSAEL